MNGQAFIQPFLWIVVEMGHPTYSTTDCMQSKYIVPLYCTTAKVADLWWWYFKNITAPLKIVPTTLGANDIENAHTSIENQSILFKSCMYVM